MKLKIIAFFFTCFSCQYALGQNVESYRLIEMDTSVIPLYNYFVFSRAKDTFKVLSCKSDNLKEGYWQVLKIGKIYDLRLTTMGSLKLKDNLYLPTGANGLYINKKQLLKADEFFYESEEINGILIKSSKRIK